MTLLHPRRYPGSTFLPDSLLGAPGAPTSAVPRLRLAQPSARSLAADLERALRMLDAPSAAPLVPMLRFSARPRFAVIRLVHRDHPRRRP